MLFLYDIIIEVSLWLEPRIYEEIVSKYGHIVAFKADMHHIYVHGRLDASWTWLTLPYWVDDDHIDKAILEWKEEWRPIELPLGMVYQNRKKKKTTQTDAAVTDQVETGDEAWKNIEVEALRKAQEDVVQQEEDAPWTKDPLHSTTDIDENMEENEDTEESSMANVLPDDAEIVEEENNPEVETPATSKKRTAEGGSSQPIIRVKCKATHPNLDQNLMDDEIYIITLKMGVATNDALTDF